MVDLPRLYTLAEVAAATQYSHDTVVRALRKNPQIAIVGRGRGNQGSSSPCP